MSRSTPNRSFRRRIFWDNHLHWYWQHKEINQKHKTNKLALDKKNIQNTQTKPKPAVPSTPVRTVHIIIIIIIIIIKLELL